jgi:hypothetical protein
METYVIRIRGFIIGGGIVLYATNGTLSKFHHVLGKGTRFVTENVVHLEGR